VKIPSDFKLNISISIYSSAVCYAEKRKCTKKNTF